MEKDELRALLHEWRHILEDARQRVNDETIRPEMRRYYAGVAFGLETAIEDIERLLVELPRAGDV